MTTAQRDLQASAKLFHALSDETRLELVERLRTGERCVCELMDHLDAAQSRLSFHLKVLRDAGIVDSRKEGRWAYYWLKPEAFEEISELIKVMAPTAAAVRSTAARCCD